eukprot:4380821-Amphidinium_carterae.1
MDAIVGWGKLEAECGLNTSIGTPVTVKTSMDCRTSLGLLSRLLERRQNGTRCCKQRRYYLIVGA